MQEKANLVENQEKGNVTRFINKYFIWIMVIVNPINIGLVFHLYFSEAINESRLFLGIYSIAWAFLAAYRIIYPMTKKSYKEFKKMRLEEQRDETPAESINRLIDESWEDFEKEKKAKVEK